MLVEGIPPCPRGDCHQHIYYVRGRSFFLAGSNTMTGIQPVQGAACKRVCSSSPRFRAGIPSAISQKSRLAVGIGVSLAPHPQVRRGTPQVLHDLAYGTWYCCCAPSTESASCLPAGREGRRVPAKQQWPIGLGPGHGWLGSYGWVALVSENFCRVSAGKGGGRFG